MSNYYSSIISTILLCVLLLSASTTTTVNGDNTCSTSNGGDEAQDTIYLKVCEDPELLTLCQLLTSTGLEGDLSKSTTGREFTLFAPINSAFTGAPPHLIGFDTKQLKKTLKYHVTSGNKDTTSGDDTVAADDNNNNRKLSCATPTSTVLGDLTSQTQCSVEDDGTTQTRIGQLGKVIVKGTPLFVDGSDSDDTPCNGRIIKVTNILGSGFKFFPPQKNGKNGKNGKSSKDGKSRKGGVRGGGGGAWRNYGNNNNSVQQDELLFTYFGVRASNNNYNNNYYNTKKGPKSFKAGKDFKAGKSFKNHYGGFYGKAAKKGKRE